MSAKASASLREPRPDRAEENAGMPELNYQIDKQNLSLSGTDTDPCAGGAQEFARKT